VNSKGQYPAQPTYPVQPPGSPVYLQTLHIPQAPPYTDALPAYSDISVTSHGPVCGCWAFGSTIPMAYYPVGPIYPAGSTGLVEGEYDAGARFGAGNIPPPPPGCPPNAAQLAVMQGANSLITQWKGNFFMGGSDGGYTIC
uniref:DAZ-associated protein 2 n=1 Tax=Cebus imitator TaxID=2715852 RepID=A0A2K5SBU6_CEBIM